MNRPRSAGSAHFLVNTHFLLNQYLYRQIDLKPKTGSVAYQAEPSCVLSPSLGARGNPNKMRDLLLLRWRMVKIIMTVNSRLPSVLT